MYDEGISREGELLDLGVENEHRREDRRLVLASASERIGQGRENARMFLKEHPDVRAQARGEVRPALGLPAGRGGARRRPRRKATRRRSRRPQPAAARPRGRAHPRARSPRGRAREGRR